MSDFDWLDEKDSVIVPHQSAIAVYANSNGDCVIRSQKDWNEDDDPYVVIAKKNIPSVIAALQKYLSESADD